ncbi:MAG: aminopeptidase P family protein [Rhodobacteraceae bacterium]|nr:aminopeptidase P family protein [Paracoccaceae bacterium]
MMTDIPISRLRAFLAAQSLDGMIVPRADVYQSEVTAPHDDCLAFLTGFTGSAGMALVLPQEALLFVDGRYKVQARQQVDAALFALHHLHDEPPEMWLRANGRSGWRIGADPLRLTLAQYDRLSAACSLVGAELVPLQSDPFDIIWPDRPPPPLGPVRGMPAAKAGATSAEKRDRIAATLRGDDADLLVETQPDNIAWLLNVRGSDVPMNPVPQSFLILHADGRCEWFVDSRKLGNRIGALDLGDVVLTGPESFASRLGEAVQGRRVLADPDFAPAALRAWVDRGGGTLVPASDPITLAKAIKTPAELAGFREAHLADGVALTSFLAWLTAEVPRREAAGHPVTELEAEARLHAFRAAQPGFLEDSFRTISAAGANAAMCHYAATTASDAVIVTGRPYLVDSGGQYATGTTDVTRTVMFGVPDRQMKDACTAVLKGFLSLLTARFPVDTKGHQLDAFARRALWDIGLDYDHGTGHGVGHNLLIHEYPFRFAKTANPFGLRPGAIMTIEPGFYAEGAFGIRIENQVEVVADPEAPGFCRFVSLTLAPIDLTMVHRDALTAAETAKLDAYHAEVRRKLAPLVDDATRDYLARVCPG